MRFLINRSSNEKKKPRPVSLCKKPMAFLPMYHHKLLPWTRAPTTASAAGLGWCWCECGLRAPAAHLHDYNTPENSWCHGQDDPKNNNRGPIAHVSVTIHVECDPSSPYLYSFARSERLFSGGCASRSSPVLSRKWCVCGAAGCPLPLLFLVGPG